MLNKKRKLDDCFLFPTWRVIGFIFSLLKFDFYRQEKCFEKEIDKLCNVVVAIL